VTDLLPAPDIEEKTVRPWRRAFLGLYLAFTLAAILTTFFSVLVANCGGSPVPEGGPQISPGGQDPADLRGCHKDLERLLSDLHREAFTVQGKALRYDTDPGAEWRNWSQEWRLTWRSLGWRCRFDELGGKEMSPEIDQMAAIHRQLEELQLSYSGLVEKFVDTYVDRLRKLRKELGQVRDAIDRRKPGGASPARSETSGASS